MGCVPSKLLKFTDVNNQNDAKVAQLQNQVAALQQQLAAASHGAAAPGPGTAGVSDYFEVLWFPGVR